MTDDPSETPTEAFDDGHPRDSGASPDRQIDRYRLLRRIGQGGMGEVWLAEQTEPVRRRVAVKIIKRGMDSAQVIARFEAERQALALMDHPNIAKVLDAGQTASGLPFFVMEYVDGEPITVHCDRRGLDLESRLDLFLQACAGAQHAHHKAVVHRDLKPSNILVSVVDGVPLVKVIDFGIAKAVEQRLTERSAFTEIGTLVGTPEYMSPEQAEMGAVDVDTRTDVYSLGVVLYELLTGALPLDSRELRAAGYDELRRRIREEEPPAPSTRVSEAGRRRVSRNLANSLRGDLDWITMRALEKDRARRYESPAALAEDLRRHLRREPVAAGPPSAVYRARRFVRRHRFGVATATAAALVLFSVAVGATWQAKIVSRERDSAERGRIAAEEAALFLSTLFDAANPVLPAGGARSIDEILDAARDRFLGTTSTSGSAELRARVADRLGSALEMRGRSEEARAVLESGLSRARGELGPDHRVTLRIANQLAFHYTRSGSCADAEWLHLDVLARQRKALGAEDPETIWSLNNLAYAYVTQGRFAEAEPLYLEVVDLRTKVLGEGHRNTLRARCALANIRLQLGRVREAETATRRILDVARGVLGPEDVDALDWAGLHASILAQAGRLPEAVDLASRLQASTESILGPEHETTIRNASRLALIQTTLGRYDEAEALLRRSLASVSGTSGDGGLNGPLLFALAELHAARGSSDHSKDDLSRLLAAARERADRCLTDAAAANGYAWTLLTAPDPESRDPRAALDYSRRANAIVGESVPTYLETLALALAANGDVPGAVRTAQAALARLSEEPSLLRSSIEKRLKDWSATPR